MPASPAARVRARRQATSRLEHRRREPARARHRRERVAQELGDAAREADDAEPRRDVAAVARARVYRRRAEARRDARLQEERIVAASPHGAIARGARTVVAAPREARFARAPCERRGVLPLRLRRQISAVEATERARRLPRETRHRVALAAERRLAPRAERRVAERNDVRLQRL